MGPEIDLAQPVFQVWGWPFLLPVKLTMTVADLRKKLEVRAFVVGDA